MANVPLGTVLRRLRGLNPTCPPEDVTDGKLLERFTTGRDEAAFAALLRRHGPMVLGVGNRVLGQVQDAEDVLQATFLLLARKAGSIRRGEALGGWLHAVAFRLAVKVRGQREMRRQRETRAAARRPPEADAARPAGFEAAWRELQGVLDEELGQLPERYRVPLVLCYLEGKTQEEVQRQLGCPLGTVRSRLARARQLLRGRLTRRRLTLSAEALAMVLAANTAAAALPVPIFLATLQAGCHFAGGGKPADGISAQAATLVEGGLRTMSGTKRKISTALILLVGLVATGAAVLAQGAGVARKTPETSPAAQVRQPDGGAKPRAKPNKPPKKEPVKQMTFTGRVLTPEGKPAAGAQVALVGMSTRPLKPKEKWPDQEEVLGITKVDHRGRFRLTVRRTSSRDFSSLKMIAAAKGYGLDWQNPHPDTTRLKRVFRLRPEQVVRGRLVDLQGKGAAGVKLQLAYMGDDKARENRDIGLWKHHPGLSLWPGPVTTDARGRFVLGGLGRKLLFGLRVRDDRYARQDLHRIATGDGQKAKPITLLLEPPRFVEGQITFADTGKPVPHAAVTIRCFTRRVGQTSFDHGEATCRTDDQGRYRVNTYPGTHIVVITGAPSGSLYLGATKDLAWPKGATKHRVNLALARNLALTQGVAVNGKVTEQVSSKPVARVAVTFWRGTEAIASAETGADGRFRLKVLPGPGTLLFRSPQRNYIQQPVYRDLGSGKFTIKSTGKRFEQTWNVDAFHEVNLKPAGVKSVKVNVVLRRGQTIQGRLIGPSGKAVAKVRMLCQVAGAAVLTEYTTVEFRQGRFTLTGCDPDLTYTAFFLDAKHQWGVVARIAGKKARGKPLTVRLAPCGSAVVRLLDSQGLPIKNYRPNPFGFQVLVPAPFPTNPKARLNNLPPAAQMWLVRFDPWHYSYPYRQLRTDAQGRITLPGLVPGVTYQIWERGVVREFKVVSGKVVKLKDIQLP
jgi:RNA polymerase sigma factor (sigma-70 family)